MGHLVDFNVGRFRAVQLYSELALRDNLRTLLTVAAWLAKEATSCSSFAEGRVSDDQADRVEDLKRRVFKLYDDLKP